MGALARGGVYSRTIAKGDKASRGQRRISFLRHFPFVEATPPSRSTRSVDDFRG